MSLYKSFGSDDPSFTFKAGNANLNEFNFAFTDMGQGDCTVISCPDNSVYVVDCGSSGGLEDTPFSDVKALVRNWASGNGCYVILTHPDKDHYNKLIDLLYANPKVGVGTIFFSKAASDTSPLGNYKQTALGSNLWALGNPLLIEVTLNTTTHKLKKWTKLADYKVAFEENIPTTGYVVRNGTTAGNTPWSLTIIAGNVQTASNSPAEKSNVVSLVTVAQLGTEKLVLTGDATADTLNYIYNSQSAHIQNASIFLVPHHGSESSFPSDGFRDWVDPQSLLVSVGILVDSYNLPRYNVINKWGASPRLRQQNYTIDYWKNRDEVPAYNSYDKISKILTEKWNGYQVDNNFSRTFFWLKNPANAGPSGTGFYGFTYNGFFLYRETINKDIYMTGIEGSKTDHGFQ